jgi:homoserine O-acetyltransferase
MVVSSRSVVAARTIRHPQASRCVEVNSDEMTSLTALSKKLPPVSVVYPRGETGTFETTLALVHGGRATVEVQYEFAGSLDAPLLVVAGGISAGRHVLANSADPAPGWWQSQAGALACYRVVAIDWIGGDGSLDAPIDAGDQAAALLALFDLLEIDGAAAFIGSSYGAMMGMQGVALAPHRFGALLAISASASAHPFTSAQRALQRQAIELGERLGDPVTGVALARKIAMLSYRTAEEFEERFPDPVTVANGRACVPAETYLDAQGERHCRRMTSVAYRRLSESIDLHAIDPAAITVPATFVAVDSDRLIPSPDIRALAERAPDGRFVSLTSLFGHDAFLKENRLVARIIADFLQELPQ